MQYYEPIDPEEGDDDFEIPEPPNPDQMELPL